MFTRKYLKGVTVLLFSALLMRIFPAFGQNTSDSLNQKHVENVTVYGTSKPIIQKAYKINQKPQFPKIHMNTFVHFKDNFTGMEAPTTITLQPIKPKLISGEIKGTVWNNIIRAGLGSRISPYVEFFHSGGVESSYRFHVHLYHFSSYKNIKNYLPSPYSNNRFETDFEKYFDYHILNFKAVYKLNRNRYYGHETSRDTVGFNPKDSQFKQRYQEGDFAINYTSTYRNFDKLHHRIHAETYYLWDLRNVSELFAGLNFDIHKSFAVYNLFNHQQVGLESKYSYYREQPGVNANKATDKYLNGVPYFAAKYGIIAFKAGLNIQWLKAFNQNGLGVNHVKLHFYPLLRIKVNVIPRRLSLFGGVRGGLSKNSLKKLAAENPFLYSFNNEYRWQNTKLEFYGGLKGNIAHKLDFDFHTSYRTFKDMAFFDYPEFISSTHNSPYSDGMNPISYLNAFNIRYASGNLTAFSAGLTFVNSSSVKVWLVGNFNHYQMDNHYRPVYKPLKEVRLGCSVKVSKKIRPWIEAYYNGTRWASRSIIGSGSQISYYYQLPAYYDINLGSDYPINTQLSAFLKVTNLLNQKYMQFNSYPVPGLEIMVGASYKF